MNIVLLYKGVMPRRRQAEYEAKYISYTIILHTCR